MCRTLSAFAAALVSLNAIALDRLLLAVGFVWDCTITSALSFADTVWQAGTAMIGSRRVTGRPAFPIPAQRSPQHKSTTAAQPRLRLGLLQQIRSI